MSRLIFNARWFFLDKQLLQNITSPNALHWSLIVINASSALIIHGYFR